MTVRLQVSPAPNGLRGEFQPHNGGDLRTRVAIGVYDTCDQLKTTFDRLAGYAFAPVQIGLLATRHTLKAIACPEPGSDPTWQPISHLLSTADAVTVGAHTWDSIVASRGVGQDAARRLVQISVDRVWHGGGSWSGTTRELESQLRKGAIALAVAAETPDQQSLSTQILLESSRYPIETISLSVSSQS